MAKQSINIGSGPNARDGDPLRTSFTKINQNFDEVYLDIADLNSRVERAGNTLERDIIGSVLAQDSTVLVDSVNGTINATALTGALPAVDGSALTGVVNTETDPIVGAINGIVKADGAGNISAAVAGTDYIVSETIDLATLKTEVAASADFADFQARIAAL